MGKPLGQFDDQDVTPRPVEVSTVPQRANAAPKVPHAPVQHRRSWAKIAALATVAAIGSCSVGSETAPASGGHGGAESAEAVPQATPKLVAGLIKNDDGTTAFTLSIRDLKKPVDFVVTPLEQAGQPKPMSVSVHYDGTKPAEMLSKEFAADAGTVPVTAYTIEAFDTATKQQIPIGTPKPENGIEGPDHFGK